MDKTKIAVGIFDKLANEYQNRFMDVSAYGSTFDLFCNSIPKQNANVLELACGPGNITQYILKKRPDFKILATDLAPCMLELAKINNPTAEFKILDSRKIDTLNKGYNAIMCGFCLPYLSKEEAIQLIENASNLLENDGVLYISTIEDDYSKPGFEKGSQGDEIFMHYHQADYLSKALEANHFQIINTTRVKSTFASGKEVTDLILIAKKN